MVNYGNKISYQKKGEGNMIKPIGEEPNEELFEALYDGYTDWNGV